MNLATKEDQVECHPTGRTWAYWEQRAEWKSKQPWHDLMIKLFEADTIEGFFRHYDNVPKISDVFFDNNVKRCRNFVDREDPKEERVLTQAKGYFLMCTDLPICDYRYENPPGTRIVNNGFRFRLADSLATIHKIWEATMKLILSERLDPDNLIAGIYLNDQGRSGSSAQDLEIWFKERDDTLCMAVCAELRAQLNQILGIHIRTVERSSYFVKKYQSNIALNANDVIITRGDIHEKEKHRPAAETENSGRGMGKHRSGRGGRGGDKPDWHRDGDKKRSGDSRFKN